jgi:hypothetical protein
MISRRRLFAVTLMGSVGVSCLAAAQDFSTTAVKPSQLPRSGSVTGAYPSGGNETRYYFAADLKAGMLATQIAYQGAPDASKMIEFALLNSSGREVDSYYVKSFGENFEGVRTFRIDNSGTYTIKLNLKGPETATFKVDLGGSSLAGKVDAPVPENGAFSTSYIAPSPLPANGIIAGTIPKGKGYLTSYYFAMPLKGGQLMSQIGASGSGSTSNMIDLALLKEDGRAIDNYYTKSFEKNHEATRNFPVANSGTYVVRVTVQGAETTKFKAEVGGTAMAAK